MLHTTEQKKAILQAVEKRLICENLQVLDATEVQVGWIMPSGKIFDFGIDSKHSEYKKLLYEPIYPAGIIRLRKELPQFKDTRLNISIHKRPSTKQMQALIAINRSKILHWDFTSKGYKGKKFFTNSEQGTGSKRKFIFALQHYYDI